MLKKSFSEFAMSRSSVTVFPLKGYFFYVIRRLVFIR